MPMSADDLHRRLLAVVAASGSLLRSPQVDDVIPAVQLFARAENVLNRVYEEPEGFQAPYFQAFFGVKARF